ncbi:hypothetical protein ONZ45_g438 [Pleurotus djamor]|nr:hypothetical protein ONZ45_g438 [Pleurotus djamor]
MIDEAIAKAINKKKEASQEAAAAMDEAVDEIASLEALVAAGEVATSLAPEVDDASPSPYAPLRAALPSTYATRASSSDVATPSVQAVYANSVGAPTHVKAAYASSSSAPCSQDSNVPSTTYYLPPALSYPTAQPTTSPILPSSHIPTIPSVKTTSIC